MRLAFALALVGTPAIADLSVTFVEGAPKDSFVITADQGCNLAGATVTLDLSATASGLIFDVTGNGAGVEVFQPLEITAGTDALAELPLVSDGDQSVSFRLGQAPLDGRLAFTIDVDDTAGSRAITVSDSEMAGAVVQVQIGGETYVGPFDGPSALVTIPGCGVSS